MSSKYSLGDIKEAIELYADIIDAQVILKHQEDIVKLEETKRKEAERVFHELIRQELVSRKLIEDIPLGDLCGETQIYTDRTTECTSASNPIKTCVEVGWQDECIYCKSIRYDITDEGIEIPMEDE